MGLSIVIYRHQLPTIKLRDKYNNSNLYFVHIYLKLPILFFLSQRKSRVWLCSAQLVTLFLRHPVLLSHLFKNSKDEEERQLSVAHLVYIMIANWWGIYMLMVYLLYDNITIIVCNISLPNWSVLSVCAAYIVVT